mgnify:CR=1 FL=1
MNLDENEIIKEIVAKTGKTADEIAKLIEDKELELEFRRVCGGMNRTNRSYPFNVLMADKRSNSEGLQIADLLARPFGLSVFKPEQLNRAYEVAKNKFYKGRHGFVGGNGKKIFP